MKMTRKLFSDQASYCYEEKMEEDMETFLN